MAEEVSNRIAERNMAAAEHMRGQGMLLRLKSRLGLASANTLDRVASVVDTDRNVFVGMSALGALKGAVLGTVASVAVIAFFGLAAMGLGLVAFAALAGTGAAIGAIYHGQDGLDEHLQHRSDTHMADKVATLSGAIAPSRDIAKSATEPRLSVPDPVLETQVRKTFDAVGYAGKETLRREASQGTRGPRSPGL